MPAATRSRAPTATACWRARWRACTSAAARCGGASRWTRPRCTSARPWSPGVHDFTAFTRTQTIHTHFHRDVTRSEWVGRGRRRARLLDRGRRVHAQHGARAGRHDAGGGLRALHGRPLRRPAGGPARGPRPETPPPRTGCTSSTSPILVDRMRVLLTNDDGIGATGLHVLRKALLARARHRAGRDRARTPTAAPPRAASPRAARCGSRRWTWTTARPPTPPTARRWTACASPRWA